MFLFVVVNARPTPRGTAYDVIAVHPDGWHAQHLAACPDRSVAVQVAQEVAAHYGVPLMGESSCFSTRDIYGADAPRATWARTVRPDGASIDLERFDGTPSEAMGALMRRLVRRGWQVVQDTFALVSPETGERVEVCVL